MAKAVKKEETRGWIAAGLVFLLADPMWMWGINQLIMTFIGLLLFLVLFPTFKTSKSSKWLLLAYFFQVIFLWVAIVNAKTNLNGFLQLFITFFYFSTIFLCEKNYWKSIIDKFIIILALLLIPALIEHILLSFVGISIPYHYITECPSNPGREYYIYNFNAYLIESFDIGKIRCFAFFDEPGVVGNIMMVLLYIQKFDLKKWYNIILLITGILSFSLAFYFAVIAYYLVVGGIKIKISFVIAAIALVVLFYDNPLVEELLFSRMAIEDGQLVGYNREGADFDAWFSNRTIGEYFFFGYGGNVEYAASWKWALVRWGVVPCFLYFFSIICNAIHMRLHKRELLLCFMISSIIFIQRPFFMNYLYALLFVVPHLYLSSVQDNYTNQVAISCNGNN